jgi:peptidoglycan/LPS O-acetylase OafA/YrhL
VSGGDVAVTGDDDGMAIHAPGADAAAVTSAVTRLAGLPASTVHVAVGGPIPRTETGKVDYAAIRPPADRRCDDSVAAIYRDILGRRDVRGDDTFVSLGGDSMNYVESSVRLERVLGRLPPDWHLLPVAQLERTSGRERRIARVDTTVLLRAVAIAAVGATHMRVRHVPGGAHLLLAVVGYNLSRFQLPIESAAARVRAGLRTVARIAAPTMLWVAAGMAFAGAYSAGTFALVNNYVGPPGHRDDHWHFWFIEVLVHLCLLTTLLLAVAPVRRVERRYPYAFPAVLLAVALVVRMEWAWMDDWYNLRYRTHGVAWFFVLGWLAQRSSSRGRRVVTTAICVVSIIGFFRHPEREWFIVAGLALLVWCPQLPWPRAAARPLGVLAAASMWILITHFTVWPLLSARLPLLVAYLATLATGIAAWAVVEPGGRLARRWARSRRQLARRSGGGVSAADRAKYPSTWIRSGSAPRASTAPLQAATKSGFPATKMLWSARVGKRLASTSGMRPLSSAPAGGDPV